MNRAVLVTRHPSDCEELQRFLRPCGITVRPYPVLRLDGFDDAASWSAIAARLQDAEWDPWLVLASPRAPSRVVERARHYGADGLLDRPVAVVGDGTAAAAAEAGLKVTLRGPGSGSGLATLLVGTLEPGTPVVLACGKDRRPELPEALEAAGHRVCPVVVYAMRPTPPRELPPLGPDLVAVVVTSPRAARLYLDAVGGHPLPLRHWALGETTRDAAAGLGIRCEIPPHPTLTSLAEELCRT